MSRVRSQLREPDEATKAPQDPMSLSPKRRLVQPLLRCLDEQTLISLRVESQVLLLISRLQRSQLSVDQTYFPRRFGSGTEQALGWRRVQDCRSKQTFSRFVPVKPFRANPHHVTVTVKPHRHRPSEAKMASITALPVDAAFPITGPPKIRCHPLPCSLVFFACDSVAIMLTGPWSSWANAPPVEVWTSIAISPLACPWSVHCDSFSLLISILALFITRSLSFAAWSSRDA